MECEKQNLNVVKKLKKVSYCYVLIVCFAPDLETFCSLFKIRRHVIGCINHGVVVVGFCSKLLMMRLSYYVHPSRKW